MGGLVKALKASESQAKKVHFAPKLVQSPTKKISKVLYNSNSILFRSVEVKIPSSALECHADHPKSCFKTISRISLGSEVQVQPALGDQLTHRMGFLI